MANRKAELWRQIINRQGLNYRHATIALLEHVLLEQTQRVPFSQLIRDLAREINERVETRVNRRLFGNVMNELLIKKIKKYRVQLRLITTSDFEEKAFILFDEDNLVRYESNAALPAIWDQEGFRNIILDETQKMKILDKILKNEDDLIDYIYSLNAVDRKSTRLNSSHSQQSRMPSSA